jgi:hypothetical protein
MPGSAWRIIAHCPPGIGFWRAVDPTAVIPSEQYFTWMDRIFRIMERLTTRCAGGPAYSFHHEEHEAHEVVTERNA